MNQINRNPDPGEPGTVFATAKGAEPESGLRPLVTDGFTVVILNADGTEYRRFEGTEHEVTVSGYNLIGGHQHVTITVDPLFPVKHFD